jgi:hypothetical protein
MTFYFHFFFIWGVNETCIYQHKPKHHCIGQYILSFPYSNLFLDRKTFTHSTFYETHKFDRRKFSILITCLLFFLFKKYFYWYIFYFHLFSFYFLDMRANSLGKTLAVYCCETKLKSDLKRYIYYKLWQWDFIILLKQKRDSFSWNHL